MIRLIFFELLFLAFANFINLSQDAIVIGSITVGIITSICGISALKIW